MQIDVLLIANAEDSIPDLKKWYRLSKPISELKGRPFFVQTVLQCYGVDGNRT